MVATTWAVQRWRLRRGSTADVGDAGGPGDRGQELVVGVRFALEALVVVEDLDEVPAAALFAGGDRGGAGGLGLLVDDREVAELEPGFPLRHLGVDHLRERLLRRRRRPGT